MLIDNAHHLLCLDDSAAMRADVKGPHIPLATRLARRRAGALPGLLIVTVRLSDGMRPVRLMLDSGTNGPSSYNTSQYMALPAIPRRAFPRERCGWSAAGSFRLCRRRT